MKIIEANPKSEIFFTKTLARIYALDSNVEHFIKDFYNQRAKFQRAKLGSLISLQILMKDLKSSQRWFSTYLIDEYKQLTYLFLNYKRSFDWLEQYQNVLFIDYT